MKQKYVLNRKKGMIFFGLLTLLIFIQNNASAALKLDRTRAIFPGDEKKITLLVENENSDNPYLAQSWLEDPSGNDLKKYFIAVPPLTRVNPKEKLIIRLEKLMDADTLPQDRESMFYYVLREIPPKVENENVLQLSLQTKIKLFYRPESILNKKNNEVFYKDIALEKKGTSFNINNNTAYYVVLLAIFDNSSKKLLKNISPTTIPPFTSINIPQNDVNNKNLSIVFIDDWGGRPVINYNCNSSQYCEYKGITKE